MLAKQLYERCDEKTKKIIQTYTEITYEHSNNDGILDHDFFNFVYENGQGTYKHYCHYLLVIAEILDHEIAEAINYNSAEYKKTLVEITKESKSNFCQTYLEVCFHQKPITKIPIYGGLDLSYSIICIERILINLINQHQYDFLFSESEKKEIIEGLENLAQKKEAGDYIKVDENRNTISNNHKLTSNYKGVGEVLTDSVFLEDPLIGREKEFRKFCANIMDKEKSVIIYGPPGVGKTTLAKSLAYKIQRGMVPKGLENRPIIKVEARELISGASRVGDVEARMDKFLHEVQKNPNNIVFIDEIHTLMGLGQGSNSNNDVSNILKDSLGEGLIKIIGTTTTDEYSIIKSDGAFARRFLPVELTQLSNQEILHILDVSVERLKISEGVNFSFDDNTKKQLLKLILEISKYKYQNHNMEMRYNPDASLTLLRSGYNYCKLDGEKDLTLDYMIEGIEQSNIVNETGVNYFKNQVKQLTKSKFTVINNTYN